MDLLLFLISFWYIFICFRFLYIPPHINGGPRFVPRTRGTNRGDNTANWKPIRIVTHCSMVLIASFVTCIVSEMLSSRVTSLCFLPHFLTSTSFHFFHILYILKYLSLSLYCSSNFYYLSFYIFFYLLYFLL